MIHRSHAGREDKPDVCERCDGELTDSLVALGPCPGAEPNGDGRTWRAAGTLDPTTPVVLPDWPVPGAIEGPGD